MRDRPVIKTAIPKGRYQVGQYAASLLGEIESGDGRPYRYILAFIRNGEYEPRLYVCAERTPPSEGTQDSYRLRLIGELMTEVVDTDQRWGDLETFRAQGLELGAQVLGLQQAKINKLM